MGLFSKSIGPVFIKETSDADLYSEKLQELLQHATGENAKKIERQINITKAGQYGEKNIAFELKNSGMDMYILHDICLEIDQLSAQIDYMVITRKHIYVIECKNLIGDIEIDHTGAFVRKYEFGGKTVKEGIYSPITQNQRHLQVLKSVRASSKTNFITKMFFEKNFNSSYQSIVVLANPKTCLNYKYAPKEIKNQVIRADQLIAYIKKKDSESKDEMSKDAMLELAQFYLEQNHSERSDYAQKYKKLLADMDDRSSVEENNDIKKDNGRKNCETDENLVKELKAYRLNQCKKEGIKPYYIFNDTQMQELLEKQPKTKDELLKVSGFGNVKVEKYGTEILRILSGE